MAPRYTRKATKALQGLPKKAAERVRGRVERFFEGESDVGLSKLTDVEPPTWKLRAGNFRVLFRKDDEGYYVVGISDRKDSYRKKGMRG